jgi:hypothetical protein
MGIYDIVVPKDNMLRQMNDLVDFSFVHEELQNKYVSIMVVMQCLPFECSNIYMALKLAQIRIETRTYV